LRLAIKPTYPAKQNKLEHNSNSKSNEQKWRGWTLAKCYWRRKQI